MTNEEIIQGLQFTIDMFLFDPFTGESLTEPRNDDDKITIDACKEAIKVLKAEPCENAVSLDGVIDTIEWYRTNPQHFTEDNLIEDIKGLPPVTPKPRTGKWILVRNKLGATIDRICSCCNRSHEKTSDYCPNCGAKMEGASE